MVIRTVRSPRPFESGTATVRPGKKLIIPLGLFFTHHPSKYFPLAAIAGCNDVRITIRFKTKEELLCADAPIPVRYSELDPSAAPVDAGLANLQFPNGNAFVSGSCQLRCHYIHVTGPEATQLMNREHVRLMKFWTGNHVSKVQRITCTPEGRAQSVDIDLSFLHPVTELVITIRKSSDMTGLLGTAAQLGDSNATQVTARPAMTKSYFSYHGGGYNPNLDEWPNRYDLETQTSRLVQVNASAINFPKWPHQNPVVQAINARQHRRACGQMGHWLEGATRDRKRPRVGDRYVFAKWGVRDPRSCTIWRMVWFVAHPCSTEGCGQYDASYVDVRW